MSQKTAPTNITIHPFLKSDLETGFLLAEAAFVALNAVVYSTNPLSDSSRAAFLAPRYESFDDDPRIKQFKAIDSVTGRLAGISRWAVYEEDQDVNKSVSEIVEGRLSTVIPERRDDVARRLWTGMQEGRRDILSIDASSADYSKGKGDGVKYKKRVELENLAVHPDFQGQGIARVLLGWGLDEAERLGLDVHLEATEAGRGLYERVGFEVLRVQEFVFEGLGGRRLRIWFTRRTT